MNLGCEIYFAYLFIKLFQEIVIEYYIFKCKILKSNKKEAEEKKKQDENYDKILWWLFLKISWSLYNSYFSS